MFVVSGAAAAWRFARRSPVKWATALALACVIGLSMVGAGRAAEGPVPLKRGVVQIGGGMAGAARSYAYYVPRTANLNGYNLLVFALPDNGQTAEEFARASGWTQLADRDGFVIIFPEAANKTWSPNSGDEDEYLKAVYNEGPRNLMADAPAGAGPGGGQGGAQAPAARAPGQDLPARARPADDEGPARPPQRGGPRAGAWQPWNYFTGAGAGAVAAQEFAMNNPGLVAAVATLNGVAYPAQYARSEEPAQGYWLNQRGGKTAMPAYRPAKKDVPVPAWLFTSGQPNPAQARLETYWKHSDATPAAGASRAIGGFQTAVYSNATNPVQQVRTTVVPAGTAYGPAMTAAIWDFFSHTARWSDSPNGTLGTMMTQAEVNQTFQVRDAQVGDRTYKYYVKTPSSYVKGGKALPLVVDLHGAGFPAWMYLSQIKMHEVGEKEGFVTVYINGQQNRWDFTTPEGPDDKAIRQVIDEVAANYGIDRSRVYLQGFSFGSGMTFEEGITHPTTFAAISPNSGIGDFTPEVMNFVAALKAKNDVLLPVMVVYGAVDGGGSTDGQIPAEGVIRNAVDLLKKYNHITTPDRIVRYDSPNASPYDILVPGGKLTATGAGGGWKEPRFRRYDYLSAGAQPLPLFSLVWVTDMPHGSYNGQAQTIWDYFKQWRRNPDGSLAYAK
jgi:poly(3-hydroxybutyrate) depolymerase